LRIVGLDKDNGTLFFYGLLPPTEREKENEF
jgi:hypothetical protein